MSRKEITIVVKSKPFSNIKYYEALRIAARTVGTQDKFGLDGRRSLRCSKKKR